MDKECCIQDINNNALQIQEIAQLLIMQLIKHQETIPELLEEIQEEID